MSSEDRTTEAVYAVIQQLFSEGKTAFRAGDVGDVLRQGNAPIPTWQLRAEFSKLEALNRIRCDADTGDWHLTENTGVDNSSLQDAG
ncbi:MAG: hypothetical protein AAF993_14790 [Pseudomonadota bacterium]